MMTKNRLMKYLENCKLTKNHDVELIYGPNDRVKEINLVVKYGIKLQYQLLLERWINTNGDNFERVK